MSNPFAPLNGVTPPKGAPKAAPVAEFASVMPVPKDAPPIPKRHLVYHEPVQLWPYHDTAGELLGYACRFATPDGGKTYQPLTLFRQVATGDLKWRWKGWDGLRPLYGLDRLAARPSALVLVCEGEKAADAATVLAPDCVAVTSPNGGRSAGKADWSVLKSRHVVIWPDADAPGLKYAEAAGRLILAAGAVSVAQIETPEGVAIGWDAADALAEGWQKDRALRLVMAAKPVARAEVPVSPPQPSAPTPEAGGDDGSKRGPGRPAWHDTLLGLTADFELWHTPKKMTFASVPMPEGHRENWRLSSEAFARYLCLKGFEATGRVPSKAAVEETVRILEAKAIAYGPCRREWLRVGQRDANLYLDLGCDRWRAVEVSAHGVKILDHHDLPFVRPEGMLPLPEPEFASENGINELRQFVNVSSEPDFLLVVAWLLGALRDAEEFPLLILNGEQGTGKSTLSRLLRSIVDPHAMEISSPPKEDYELFVLAQHTHLVVLDNLSKVSGSMSDVLCMLATGGAMAARTMYTNDGLSILEARRPMILNGIPSLAERPDLADRSITVRLRPVSEEERRTSEDIKRDWRRAHPRILGTLLEALSTGLRDLPSVKVDKLPRMAGFALFLVAAASGLGIEGIDGPALFNIYKANLTESASSAFENDPVANAIVTMMSTIPGGEWKGTPTELLEALSKPEVTPERVVSSFAWPRKAQLLGTAIDRGAPALRARGINVDKRHSGKTWYEIRVV